MGIRCAQILRGCTVYFVPLNEVLGAVCIEDGIFIDVFSLIREGFIA
jgi:hypothetical protein